MLDNTRADRAWRRVMEQKFENFSTSLGPDLFEQTIVGFFAGEPEERLRRVDPDNPLLGIIEDYRNRQLRGFA